MALRSNRDPLEPGALRVRETRSRGDVARYLELRTRAHAADPSWLPTDPVLLRAALRGRGALGGRSRGFLAEIEGVPVAAVVGTLYDVAPHGRVAAVGGLECAPGAVAAADAALAAAEAWARSEGARLVWGPIDGHPAAGFGCLDEGGGEPPPVGARHDGKDAAEPWWRRHYARGPSFFAHRVDLTAAAVRASSTEVLGRALPPDVEIRAVESGAWRRGVERMAALGNAALGSGWGELPLGPRAAAEIVDALGAGTDPRLVRVAESRGETIGFALACPDWNEPEARARRASSRSGAALARWLGRRRIRRGVFLGLAVARSWRGRGIATRLVAEALAAMAGRGMTAAELAPLREGDTPSHRIARRFGAVESRRYLTFEKTLGVQAKP